MNYNGILYFISFLLILNSTFYVWRFKDPKRLLLGCALFLYGVQSAYDGLFLSHDFLTIPWAFGTFVVWGAFLNVLLFLYVKFLLDKSFYWKKIYWLLFIYPVTQIILFIPHALLPDTEQVKIVQHAIDMNSLAYFPGKLSDYLHSASLAGLYLFAFYFILTRFKFSRVEKKNRRRVIGAVSVVIAWVFFSLILDAEYMYTHFFNMEQGPWSSIMIHTLDLLFLTFLQFWPYYYKAGVIYFDLKTFGIDQYIRSYLDGTDIVTLEKKFNKLVNIEKVYKDENISLPNFAEQLNVSIHQVSEYLNRHLNVKFHDLIQNKRIEESKNLLDNNPDMSIIEICFEVGFNSLPVFYKAFKKITQMTPKAWRERN
ncbi:MAG: helix-turn-helix domain-containing protein [Leptospirales bacterium]